MEYSKGLDLFDVIQEASNCNLSMDSRGGILEEEAKSIFFQILNGVQHLHSNNIIHRDIKPENIWIPFSNQSSVKLLDFGSASIISNGQESNVSPIMGTTNYMAPELLSDYFMRKDCETDLKADCWSLGVMLFVMLFSEYPTFYYSEVNAVPTVNFGALESSISVSAANLISQLLELDPSKRISTTDALRHEWFTHSNPLKTFPTTNYCNPLVIPESNKLQPIKVGY